MAYLVRIAAIRMSVPYLIKRKSGLFYYRRGIPADLRTYYQGKREIVRSLKTTDEKSAISRVQHWAKIDSANFEQLRKTGVRPAAVALLKSHGLEDSPLEKQPVYLKQKEETGHFNFNEIPSPYWHLQEKLHVAWSERATTDEYSAELDAIGGFKPNEVEKRALDILHGKEKITLAEVEANALEGIISKKKIAEIKRAFNYFHSNLSATIINDIRTRDCQGAVNTLINNGLKQGTVKKAVGIVRNAIKKTITLYDLDNIKNPFDNISLSDVKKTARPEKRHTYSYEELRLLKTAVNKKSHLLTAQIVGLLYDTGCRLGEVGGLLVNDIKIDSEDIPHLIIRHTENRSLKNDNSERIIPLTGLSLKIALKIKSEASPDQTYAFPRYNLNGRFKNEGCSQAVNKFIKSVVDQGTSHSFRHAMNDRLKNSGANLFEITSMMGWTGEGMAYHYGKTQAVERLHDVLNSMHEYERTKGLI